MVETPNTFTSKFLTGAGLIVATTVFVVPERGFVHHVALQRIPDGTDGSELLRRLLTENAATTPLQLPSATDGDKRLGVALLSCLQVKTATASMEGNVLNLSLNFTLSRAGEQAFQASPSFEEGAVGAALTSLRSPRKPWWRFW